MTRILLAISSMYFIFLVQIGAKDYNASLFGIRSDGQTLNTGSIQKAVDYISEEGGGRLMFYVGRYLTGSIEMKSNVVIHLEEGAVLVGVPSIYDYYRQGEFRALLYAQDQQKIALTGKGVLMGNARTLQKSWASQIERQHIIREQSEKVPGLIHFQDCDSVVVSGILMKDSGGDVITVEQCQNVEIENTTIRNGRFPGNGLVLTGNGKVAVTGSYLETGGRDMVYGASPGEVTIVDTNNEYGEELEVP